VSGSGAEKVLPVDNEVGEEQREGYTHPDDGFAGGDIVVIAQETGDEADFKENNGDGVAASHPVTMLLNIAAQDENHGHGGGGDPQGGVGKSCEAEGACGAHALFVILNVKTERSGDERTSDIKASDNTVEFGEALAKAIGKLHRAEEKRAGAHNAVRE